MRTQSKLSLENLNPQTALEILKKGNERFINNLRANRNLLEQVNETKNGQYPFAAILSCMDSRTSVELIFDQGLGDIFSLRVAGNVLNEDILGSMEYACKAAGSKLIVVLGHTHCGAIIGACNSVEMGNLTGLLDKIKPAIASEKTTETNRIGSNTDFVKNVTTNNVHQVVELIKQKSAILEAMEKNGEIKVVGGLYDIESGKVVFFE